jgi:hypothetical protein
MSQLEVIESIAAKVPCPVCAHTNYQIALFCEMPGDPCEYTAQCQKCDNKILITEKTKTISDLIPEIRRHVEKTECPECEGDIEIKYECDVDSKSCFFLMGCKGGHYSRLDTKGLSYLLGR